jgi:hypothetical protein
MGSTLDDLRKRSEKTKQLQEEQKVSRVRDAVTEVVNSSAFALSALNHIDQKSDTGTDVEQLASAIAEKVSKVVTDPKIEFLDTLRARGLKETRIKNAVTQLNLIFGLTSSAEYEEQLEAVALYIREHPNLYDDIALLS